MLLSPGARAHLSAVSLANSGLICVVKYIMTGGLVMWPGNCSFSLCCATIEKPHFLHLQRGPLAGPTDADSIFCSILSLISYRCETRYGTLYVFKGDEMIWQCLPSLLSEYLLSKAVLCLVHLFFSLRVFLATFLACVSGTVEACEDIQMTWLQWFLPHYWIPFL